MHLILILLENTSKLFSSKGFNIVFGLTIIDIMYCKMARILKKKRKGE